MHSIHDLTPTTSPPPRTETGHPFRHEHAHGRSGAKKSRAQAFKRTGFACPLALLAILTTALPAAAGIIELRAPLIEQLDERPSFELDIGSRAITVTALTGLLNRTAAGFGINAPGAGDDTDAIDGDLVREALEIRFDAPVIVESVTLSGIGSQDSARVQIGTAQFLLDNNGTFDVGGVLLPAHLPLTLSHDEGNGFSLDRIGFSLPVTSAAKTLPGPATGVLLGGPIAWILWRRRHGSAGAAAVLTRQ
ncbi:MAG: hypothetical protein AAF458_20930 [Pseudomonadota bacterium]